MQSDPSALAQLVQFADFPSGAWVLDAGCGPGLVGEALLRTGLRVLGVDLSAEMIERARQRCASFGDRACFEQKSVFDASLIGPFDGVVSRFVLHHAPDPTAFVRRQVELLRPGGVLVSADHTTDPDAARAAWHQDIERGRDHTHTRNLTPGELVDLLAGAGLIDLRLIEAPIVLDFDEWFDRGTPAETKEAVRARMRVGPAARGFQPMPMESGVRIDGWLALVRGVKPG